MESQRSYTLTRGLRGVQKKMSGRVEMRRRQTRLYLAALAVSNEVHESLHAGEILDDIADTEVIEVSVGLLVELRDAIGDYER